MVSYCANSECAMPLRYLRHGRLFQFEVRTTTIDGSGEPGMAPRPGKVSRKLSHFWLCGHCCQHWTLKFDTRRGMQLTALPAERVPAASVHQEYQLPFAAGA